MAQHKGAESRIPWILLLCATPLWTLWLIWSYGVDIPYWDQWDAVCPLFQKLHAGTLGLRDFLGFQNEHRIFFPRIIYLCLGLVTHWNVRIELVAIWALACVCAVNLWQLSRVTGFGNLPLGRWLCVGLTFLLFTPVQYETWLLGMQVVFLLPVVCITACLWVPFVTRPAAGFLCTMVLATISTFSVASGFIAWILAAPLLLLCNGGVRRHRAWWAIWVSMFAVNLVIYLHGYQKPSYHPSPFLFLKQPLSAISYALAYLGADFSSGPLGATIAGAFLSVLFLACITSLWMRRGEKGLFARALPWMLLGSFAFANAILTSAGRLGFGIDQALSSRYIMFSIMLPVGLLFLVPLLLIDDGAHAIFGTSRRVRTGGVALLALLLACMQLSGSVNSLQNWADMKHTRLMAKAAITYIDVVPDHRILHNLAHPDVPLLKERANALNELNYLRPRLLKTAAISEVSDPGSPGGAEFGEIELGRQVRPGVWVVFGRASLPDMLRPADAVLLTFDNNREEPVVFSFARMRVPHDDVGKSSEEAADYNSGWAGEFTRDSLPEDARSVKAWAFNAETGRAFRIKGDVELGQ